MDIYARVTDKIINLLEKRRGAVAQAVDLDRTAAQSCEQEAVSRPEFFPAFGIEVRFTVLADDPPSE